MVCLVVATPAFAEAPPAKAGAKDVAASAAALARRAWTITDLVLEQDLDPPARQQMLLTGLKAIAGKMSAAEQRNLSSRVSAITKSDQLAALLQELLAKSEAPKDPQWQEENPFLHGLGGGDGDAGREERAPTYLSPRGLKAHEVLTGNRYIGTGIQIRQSVKDKLSQIVIPFPGGPARTAGARPGDLIVEVDGKDMRGRTLQQVVKALQGEEGTPVSMTVRQPEQKETRTLNMIRSVIPFSSWQGFRRLGEDSWTFKVDPDSPVGYLRVHDIKSSTLLELRKVEPLVKEQGVRALVLDLRGSMGSDMTHAALVADGLLDGGVMWKYHDARGQVKEYKADRDCLFRDWPLAVLVDEHTNSTGAAVAMALQANGRAVVVGRPLRGPIYATSLVTLPERQGGLLLRTGVLERPPAAKGSSAEKHAAEPASPPAAVAVQPDHEVAVDRKPMQDLYEWWHEQDSPEPRAGTKHPDDPQLTKAVTVLRDAMAKQAPAKKRAG
jgi:carboxyl-terminal processing protease